MRFSIQAMLYFFGVWMTLQATLGVTVTAAGPVEGIQYDKKSGTLTVHVQDMPLNEVLQTVSAESGLKLSIQADLNRPVTMDFTTVPLDKAIHRLVQPNSSAMIYSKKEDGEVVLTSVKVFDKGSTPSSPENLPTPRLTGRSSRSAHGSTDPSVGRFEAGARGGPADQGSNRNNKKNRNQRDPAASDSGAQASGATGSQSTTAGSSGGGGRRGR